MQREAWLEWLAQADGERLAFLDETGAKTNMTRLYARSKKGARAIDFVPHGHWNTTTLVAAITLEGPLAPMLLDGPMDRDAFEAYLDQVLIAQLLPGTTLVMDNLSAHKSRHIEDALKKAGINLLYLPPYSPDFNPIEPMWAKVKNSVRGDKPRTTEELDNAVAKALGQVTSKDAKGFFQHCFVGIKN
jgi:transposase